MLFRDILLLALLVLAAVLVGRFQRRRWQFSLKWVLGATLLLCLPLGWYAAQVRRVALEQEAVDHITDIGGFVWFDDQLSDDDRGFPGNLVPNAPRWLRGLLGERIFNRVVRVRMARSVVTNDHIEWLNRLNDTRYLNLTDSAVTDEGLRHLKGLTQLEELILENTQVSDAGLKHLSPLKALGELNLRGTQVSGEGLVHLSPLKALGELNLRGTQVSDEGLVHLKGLTNLYSLNATDTAVTANGLDNLQPSLPKAALRQQHAARLIRHAGGRIGFRHDFPREDVTYVSLGSETSHSYLPLLSTFPEVEVVSLSGPHFVDADLAHLTSLSKLESLHINCPGITGVGLHHLRSLENLTFISFGLGSGLTDNGLKHVAGLMQVRRLSLDGTAVNGTGLAHLRAMKNLRRLTLNFAISDSGVESLAQLDQIGDLHFSADQITRDQWNKLRKALPNCDFH